MHSTFRLGGEPFFVLGAQCGTNNTYFREDLHDFWRAAEALRINTAELQVYWELLEPEEGRFDFNQIDMEIDECRAHGVRLVVIWFGSWKNGAMKYAPRWVKEDRGRFWRVTDQQGGEHLMLSPHCPATVAADTRAFLQMVAHIREVDGEQGTVIGIQVQNECGMLGGVRRDHRPEVDREFASAVPAGLLDCLAAREGSPVWEAWQANGARRGASWAETFGRDAEEFFTAAALARFVGSQAAQARAIHDILYYANAWMMHAGLECPGLDYPCGGPVSKVLEIWKWAAPALDLLAPDVYSLVLSRYTEDCREYAREDNPLFIPEAASQTATRWAPFVAVEQGAIGFSCMGKIYNVVHEDGTIAEGRAGMIQSFQDMSAIAPALLGALRDARPYAVVQQENMVTQLIHADGWDLLATFHPYDEYNYPANGHGPLDGGAGLVLQAGPDEFYIIGTNYSLGIYQHAGPAERWPEWAHGSPADPLLTREIGYLLVEEGAFRPDGRFVVHNRRNGDSTDGGLALLPGTQVLHVVMDPRLPRAR